MARSSNLGFPRFGIRREWKRALEGFWRGKLSSEELHAKADELQHRHWILQMKAGIEIIPVGDFAYYDHMLDMAVMLGAVPERFQQLAKSDKEGLKTYFAMARGYQEDGYDLRAMEMTKWFDTNYHYIVPELEEETHFKLSDDRLFKAIAKAREAGVETPRPVIVGPFTFLMLSKRTTSKRSNEDLLNELLGAYEAILEKLSALEIPWVQVDEPALVFDLEEDEQQLFQQAWQRLDELAQRPKLMIATYFGGISHNRSLAKKAGDGLHIDLVRCPEQLRGCLSRENRDRIYSLGVIDGRNIWRTDLDQALTIINRAVSRLGGHDQILIAPSCSLLHAPIDLEIETQLDDELRSWLAFGRQKLQEIATLTQALNDGEEAVDDQLAEARAAAQSRERSERVHNPKVRERLEGVDPRTLTRVRRFDARSVIQREKLGLPLLPTTTIGSFPQTPEVRKVRAQLKRGEIDERTYDDRIATIIIDTIKRQQEIGIDVLVHGEFERNDMVEYFGEKLEGYAFTRGGWVQSYGSRGVKPPIIFGDVSRPNPMTVRWSQFAQMATKRPMKGMLTGPVTMLQWSFVRNDQPREATASQIALAIRDEVRDLERAGVDVIQIDEPALREGLPLRKSERASYLEWAVRAFRLASTGVSDETQIHTHMCYSEFNDIFEAIASLDADVISIEASRSRMELLGAFDDFEYPNDIGPGVYDIHSPRVPSVEEIVELLQAALKHIKPERLWVNPDCGLKTRTWEEVEPALVNMVKAAEIVRASLNEA